MILYTANSVLRLLLCNHVYTCSAFALDVQSDFMTFRLIKRRVEGAKRDVFRRAYVRKTQTSSLEHNVHVEILLAVMGRS